MVFYCILINKFCKNFGGIDLNPVVLQISMGSQLKIMKVSNLMFGRFQRALNKNIMAQTTAVWQILKCSQLKSNLMEGLSIDDEARNSLRVVGHDVGRSLFLPENVLKVKRGLVSGKRHEWALCGKWLFREIR